MGAVVRPAVLVGAAVAAAVLGGCASDRVDVGGAPPPSEQRDSCRSFLDAVPDEVAGLPAREVSPADGWGAAWGDPAIVLRCGVPPPAGFDALATCTTVDGIDWYLPEQQLEEPGDVTMTTVNREPTVEVRLPEEHWPPAATLVDLAPAVGENTARTGRCR